MGKEEEEENGNGGGVRKRSRNGRRDGIEGRDILVATIGQCLFLCSLLGTAAGDGIESIKGPWTV